MKAAEEKKLWDWTRSEGGHYSKPVPVVPGAGMEALQTMFPDGVANAMNFVLFSTSGIHGSYMTIEEHEAEPICQEGDEDVFENEVTFVIVQPRLVAMRYGKVCPKTEEDYVFLKKLRQTSWDAVLTIGKHRSEEKQ